MGLTNNLKLPTIDGESSSNKVTTLGEAFTALDSALAARVVIALTGGTMTLTEAQQTAAYLHFSGTLGSNATVKLDLTQRLRRDYLVFNATSGGHELVIKTTATGSGGVLIPPGLLLLVAHDGTDVRQLTVFTAGAVDFAAGQARLQIFPDTAIVQGLTAHLGDFDGVGDGTVVSVDDAARTVDLSSAANGVLLPGGTRFAGLTTSATTPTTTELPASGDWGFHYDTAGPGFYLAFNRAGTVYSVSLT